ncbi:MAG: hypothetical protein Q9210_005938 [Variospora velana]
MHFLYFTTLALASSFIAPSFAAPASDNNALAERQSPADAPAALAIVNQLYVDVKQYTAVITKAGQTFTAAIASINTLVVNSTAFIKALPGSPVTNALESSTAVALAKRQVNPADPTGLATTLTLILPEIGRALNNIITILGLTASLSFLGPLVASLSLLLASLILVVSSILALVGALVNGILGGLNLAPAGLIL